MPLPTYQLAEGIKLLGARRFRYGELIRDLQLQTRGLKHLFRVDTLVDLRQL